MYIYIFKRFDNKRKKTKCFNSHRTLYVLKYLAKNQKIKWFNK